MASFDFFSQPQGPTVPISLFPDAATAGINAGNAQKTAIQAAVEGVTKGVQTGQEIQAKSQEAELNKAKIEQIPQQAELQRQQILINQERLKQAQFESTLKNLDVQTKLLTQDTDQDLAVQEAQNKLDEANKKAALAQKGKDIQAVLQSDADAATKAKVYTDPSNLEYWSLHPEEQKQGISTYWGEYQKDPNSARTAGYLRFGGLQRQIEENIALAEAKGTATPQQKEYTKAMGNAFNKTDINTIYTHINGDSTPTPLNQLEFLAKSSVRQSADELDPLDKTPLYVLTYDGKDQEIKLHKADADAFTAAQNAARGSSPEAQATFDSVRQAAVKKREDEAKANTDPFKVSKYGEAPNPFKPSEQAAPQGTPSGPPATPPSGPQFQGAPQFRSRATDVPSEAEPTPDNSQGGPSLTSSSAIQPTPQSTPVKSAQPTITANSPVVEQRAKELQAKSANLSPEDQKIFNEKLAGVNNMASEKNGVRSFSEDTNLDQKPEPQATPANYVRPRDQIPPEVKKTLPKGYQTVVNRVASNPHLKGVKPIFKAVVAAESAGREDAVSPTGVKGLFQLTRDAAIDASRIVGRRLNRDNPKDNVEGGIAYLQYLMGRFPGRTDLALAAYNGGEGTIKRAIKQVGSTDFNDIITWLEYESKKPGGISPEKVKEIADYPGRVKEYLYSFAHDRDPVWLTQI